MKEYFNFMPLWYKIVNILVACAAALSPVIFKLLGQEGEVLAVSVIVITVVYALVISIVDTIENIGMNSKDMAGQIDFLKCSNRGKAFLRNTFVADYIIKLVPMIIMYVLFYFLGGKGATLGDIEVFPLGIWSVLSTAWTAVFGIAMIVYINRFVSSVFFTIALIYFEIFVFVAMVVFATRIPPISILLGVGAVILGIHRVGLILEGSYHDKKDDN